MIRARQICRRLSICDACHPLLLLKSLFVQLLLQREVIGVANKLLPVDLLLLIEGVDVLDQSPDDECQLMVTAELPLAADGDAALWTLFLAKNSYLL